MSIALTTSIPCNFCRFCSTLPMYKLIFLHLVLRGCRLMTNRFTAVFFFATDRRAEFHSLLMGLIKSCSCHSLSCAVSCAESSGFMAHCFMLTGVSSPGFNSTRTMIQSVLSASPCPMTWCHSAPPSNTCPFRCRTCTNSSPTFGFTLIIGLSLRQKLSNTQPHDNRSASELLCSS